MMLLHVQLLLRLNCPVYADVEPSMNSAVEGLRVTAVGDSSIQIEGLNEDKPIQHGLSMLDEVGLIRAAGLNIRIHCANEDPVGTLLEAGMDEVELTDAVMHHRKR